MGKNDLSSKRDVLFKVRVTKEEAEVFREKARGLGLSASSMLRAAGLRKRMPSSMEHRLNCITQLAAIQTTLDAILKQCETSTHCLLIWKSVSDLNAKVSLLCSSGDPK